MDGLSVMRDFNLTTAQSEALSIAAILPDRGAWNNIYPVPSPLIRFLGLLIIFGWVPSRLCRAGRPEPAGCRADCVVLADPSLCRIRCDFTISSGHGAKQLSTTYIYIYIFIIIIARFIAYLLAR